LAGFINHLPNASKTRINNFQEHLTMKLTRLTSAGGMIVLMLSAAIYAQSETESALHQPAYAKNVAYNEYLYFAPQNGPNAATPAEPEQKAQVPDSTSAADSSTCYGNACSSCEECCGGCGWGIFACNIGDPWTLPELRFLKQRDIKVAGWLEGGIFTNQYDAVSNGPLGLRDTKYFDADQLWIYAERATNTEDKYWDIGGRIDYVYGIDGPDTQCFGDHSWDYGWNSSPSYGSAIPQLYAEVAYRNLKVKVGHFYTPIGYEVVPATGNFFYSHSYTFYYGEPFTHTGFLATYKFGDKLSGSAGWSNGWDSGFGDNNHGSMFLGGLTLTASDKLTIAWYMCSGYWGDGLAFQGANINDAFMNSLVFTYLLTERWTYIFQTDYGTNYNRPDTNAWYGINQYLLYKLNDCWSFGGRIEWFRLSQFSRAPWRSYGRRKWDCPLSVKMLKSMGPPLVANRGGPVL
jgi:hypothetical protein